jgi:hypothetical protein
MVERPEDAAYDDVSRLYGVAGVTNEIKPIAARMPDPPSCPNSAL